ncbi:VanZ family protein [Modestobacter roseus]|uniref:VanZ like protein n=1 Tax=Modestobacter roseus TaxID=1181884 RepID=A0A562IUU8_9ACTN|nr:VanZ family protein [Modestobacter roseus]TWH74543.1 VanZ like protein [Modestobacter roseus]
MTATSRRGLELALAGVLVLVALVTLTPAAAGVTAWADPVAELRWYATAPGDPAVALQLVGNLLLLVPAAVLAVLRWPALRSPGRLVAAAAAAGAAIELLQWQLPLGRVVSPVDAGLNAAGAVVAGLLVIGLRAALPGSRVPAGSAG